MDRYDTARPYLIKAAEGGHHKARYWLSTRYIYGKHGQKKDLQKGVDLLAENVREGDVPSMVELGYIAYWAVKGKGEAIKKEPNKTHKYYQMAELHGSSGVYRHWGQMYERGDYYKKDLAKAKHYYELSIKTNAPNANQARPSLRPLHNRLSQDCKDEVLVKAKVSIEYLKRGYSTQRNTFTRRILPGQRYPIELHRRYKKGSADGVYSLQSCYFTDKLEPSTKKKNSYYCHFGKSASKQVDTIRRKIKNKRQYVSQR